MGEGHGPTKDISLKFPDRQAMTAHRHSRCRRHFRRLGIANSNGKNKSQRRALLERGIGRNADCHHFAVRIVIVSIFF
jgi:hypothetical protein